MTTPEIIGTSGAGFATNPAFRALLTDASDATGADLDVLLEDATDMEWLIVPGPRDEPQALAAYRRLDAYAVEIEYLAVAPAIRRQGVARALVDRVQARSR